MIVEDINDEDDDENNDVDDDDDDVDKKVNENIKPFEICIEVETR